MYSQKQRVRALRMYHRTGSATETVRRLGYPSRERLYDWIRGEGKGKAKRKSLSITNTAEHPRNPPVELKLDVLKRCFQDGESVKSVSEEIGYSRASIYIWQKRYLQGGATSLMNRKNIIPDELPNMEEKVSTEEIETLRDQMYELQMEVDILKETLNILKKDPGADRRNLKNREKVAVIDAMKNKYPLPKMLRMMELSRSSYYYQVNARAREDKYALVRIEIKRIFKDSRSRYGYRRIHAELKKIGIGISEKIVRRLMKEEEMKVKSKKAGKYNSYKGEITPAVPNRVERDFHSDGPYWATKRCCWPRCKAKILDESFTANDSQRGILVRRLAADDPLLQKVSFEVPWAQYFEVSTPEISNDKINLDFEIYPSKKASLSFQKVSKSMYWNGQSLGK